MSDHATGTILLAGFILYMVYWVWPKRCRRCKGSGLESVNGPSCWVCDGKGKV